MLNTLLHITFTFNISFEKWSSFSIVTSSCFFVHLAFYEYLSSLEHRKVFRFKLLLVHRTSHKNCYLKLFKVKGSSVHSNFHAKINYDFWSQCHDGFLLSHRLILCGVSPFLKSIFLDQPEVVDDQLTVLIFPEIKKMEMISLLSLLYSGKANLYKRFNFLKLLL